MILVTDVTSEVIILKALTIKQPWATLIALGEKKIETRSWKTSYRGPLFIHAGKSIEDSICHEKPFITVLNNHDIILARDLPTGAIIAKANLVNCVKMAEWVLDDNYMAICSLLENGQVVKDNELEFGDYTPGRYAWILEDVEIIKPIPAKGQLSLWNFNL